MKKDELFNELLNDSILIEKGYFSELEKQNFSLEEPSTNKIVEAIKICITEIYEDKENGEISRAINKYLNK